MIPVALYCFSADNTVLYIIGLFIAFGLGALYTYSVRRLHEIAKRKKEANLNNEDR